MASALRLTVLLVLALAAFACAAPTPGGYGGKHTHFIIHVPYHVHTVHHHHKVPVYIKTHTFETVDHGGWHGWD